MTRSAETETTATARSGEEARVDRKVGCYVYGIVPADVEVSGEATGVGDPPRPVRLVTHGEIGALVSEVDLDRPLGTPAHLLAHERLLDATAAEVPVLPLRFGAVLTDESAVTGELLGPHHDEFLSALKELEGRVEYVIKARYVEQAVLAEVLRENPAAARLREQVRDVPEPVSRDARIRLGQMIEQGIAAKREADTRTVTEAVGPVCVLTSVRAPSHEEDAAHVALLVETERQDDLEQAVADLRERWAGRVEIRLLGPLAPYDFVPTSRTG